MNVFELRERLISDYSSYIRSFIRIRDERVGALVTSCLDQGRLWPDPLIQLNPSFQYAGTIEDLVAEGVLHSECSRIFRAGKDKGEGKQLRLYQHRADAIRKTLSIRPVANKTPLTPLGIKHFGQSTTVGRTQTLVSEYAQSNPTSPTGQSRVPL